MGQEYLIYIPRTLDTFSPHALVQSFIPLYIHAAIHSSVYTHAPVPAFALPTGVRGQGGWDKAKEGGAEEEIIDKR